MRTKPLPRVLEPEQRHHVSLQDRLRVCGDSRREDVVDGTYEDVADTPANAT